MDPQHTESSGVQQLIDRLHAEGVAKGTSEANDLLGAARQQAVEILDRATKEAEEIVTSARQEAARTRASGEEAVRLAGRDAILILTEELREDFVSKLRHLVSQSLRDTEFLKQLILEIGGAAVPDRDARLRILLLNDGGADAADAEKVSQQLDQFVLSLSGEALRDGLTFEVAESNVPGVRVQVVDDDLEIDLTTETLTELLLRQLSPRFRAIMES